VYRLKLRLLYPNWGDNPVGRAGPETVAKEYYLDSAQIKMPVVLSFS